MCALIVDFTNVSGSRNIVEFNIKYLLLKYVSFIALFLVFSLSLPLYPVNMTVRSLVFSPVVGKKSGSGGS